MSGLRGMANVRTLPNGRQLARPMLMIDRPSIESFLQNRGQSFLTDVSNGDRSLTRNRIRNELLPLLETDYNARVRDSILRLSQQADDMESMMNQLADEALTNVLLEESVSICRIECQHLENLPVHLRRHCFVRLWMRLGWQRKKMGFAEWNALSECVVAAREFDLPGRIHVSRRKEMMVLERAS